MNIFRRRERASERRDEAPGVAPATDRNEDEGTTPMSQPEADQVDPSAAAQKSAAAEQSAAARQKDAAEPAATPDAAAHASADAPPPGAPASSGVARIRDDVIAVLKTVYDPEIPVDIYELGLIYEVEVEQGGDVSVVMTLTTPMCPVAETLPPEVEAKVRDVPGVRHVQLELVWEPPWSMDMMSEAARLELNL